MFKKLFKICHIELPEVSLGQVVEMWLFVKKKIGFDRFSLIHYSLLKMLKRVRHDAEEYDESLFYYPVN